MAPAYDFINDKTGEIKELVFTMAEEKIYIDETGYQWRRLFSVPTAGMDTKLDVWDANSFTKKTGNMKGNLGNLFDMSREASEKRAQEAGGIDPQKKEYQDKKRKEIAEARRKNREDAKRRNREYLEKKK